jgi:predicted amidophosphoribosyltransferase
VAEKKFSEDGARREAQSEIDILVEEMRAKSPVTQGKCPKCGTEGKLISGVCEACFIPWAQEAARSQLRWKKKG